MVRKKHSSKYLEDHISSLLQAFVLLILLFTCCRADDTKTQISATTTQPDTSTYAQSTNQSTNSSTYSLDSKSKLDESPQNVYQAYNPKMPDNETPSSIPIQMRAKITMSFSSKTTGLFPKRDTVFYPGVCEENKPIRRPPGNFLLILLRHDISARIYPIWFTKEQQTAMMKEIKNPATDLPSNTRIPDDSCAIRFPMLKSNPSCSFLPPNFDPEKMHTIHTFQQSATIQTNRPKDPNSPPAYESSGQDRLLEKSDVNPSTKLPSNESGIRTDDLNKIIYWAQEAERMMNSKEFKTKFSSTDKTEQAKPEETTIIDPNDIPKNDSLISNLKDVASEIWSFVKKGKQALPSLNFLAYSSLKKVLGRGKWKTTEGFTEHGLFKCSSKECLGDLSNYQSTGIPKAYKYM